MPSTVQYYEWMNQGAGIESRSEDTNYQVPTGWTEGGISIDIFNPVSSSGAQIGNKLSKAPSVGSNQFIVIERLGVSPFLQGSMDIKVNQTYYFQLPDNTMSTTNNDDGVEQPVGISGLLFPYPCSAQQPAGRATDAFGQVGTGGITMPEASVPGGPSNYFVDTGGTLIPMMKKLDPPIYILGGQSFSFIYNCASKNAVAAGSAVPEVFPGGGTVMAFVSYTLHEGPEALIANELVGMGIPVTNNNIDWMKRQTLKNLLYEVDEDGD